jgi:cytochrome b561
MVLISHWLLYFAMIAMPISGYLLSAPSGHAVTYFGLFTLPGLPKNEALSHAADWVHVAVGQWLVYALILLHLLGNGMLPSVGMALSTACCPNRDPV